jgi:ABC-type nitrate/sulfonate/bicarbonate transport system ATPase subunit
MRGLNQNMRYRLEPSPVLVAHERDEARAVARRLLMMIDQIQLELKPSGGSDHPLDAAVLLRADELVNELEVQFPWLEEEDGGEE